MRTVDLARIVKKKGYSVKDGIVWKGINYVGEIETKKGRIEELYLNPIADEEITNAILYRK